MKYMNLRKTASIVILMCGATAAANALADPPGDGYGHGFGMGSSMMGGYGMPSDGMMCGYGMSSGGMMGGYDMRGGTMMGGYGVIDGDGNGHGSRVDLHLTSEQRGKIGKIQEGVRRQHWNLMGKMQDEQSQMNERYNADPRDDAALGKSYRKMSDLRQEMFELSLAAQKQMDGVLTAEQRDKMKRG
jgi:Spy/CpxP family protein refolding chaperone